MTRVNHVQAIGLDIHAVMLAQLLDGARLAVAPPWSLWLAALVVVVLGAATATLDLKTWQVVGIVIGEFLAVLAIPFALQAAHVDTQVIPAAGWVIGWALAYAAIGTAARGVGSDQRRFAQSAIGRYLPTEVAREIMRDPDQISLTGEKREIVALFTDLEGFTKLSHAISPEMVAYLLNRYLDMMCAIVLAHGGTIDKFVGDAVVAFWGAPIARPDDDVRALAAAVAMYEAGEWFRNDAPEGVPPIGCTRVGLHRGEAVVGNFGRRGPHPVYRAGRRDERRGQAGRRQQVSAHRGAGERLGGEACGQRSADPDGADRGLGAIDGARGVRTCDTSLARRSRDAADAV